jgi:hypothetical protein
MAPAAKAVFRAGNDGAYRRWRDAKLATAPVSLADLVVEVRDPCNPTPAELSALVERCRRANLAIYAGHRRDEDKALPRALARRLGLNALDANLLADDDAITSIRVEPGKAGAGFIPYTDRPIRWHTDGYYNEPARRIRAMVLHCVRSASAGGENRLADHEMAYIRLREREPAWAEALFAPDAMTIPAREDDDGIARPACTGPVFSLDERTGDLHMRYTARTRSIAWKDDPATREAAAFLLALLEAGGAGVYRARLEPGMGLVCNNVLHDRTGFAQEGEPRLLYRARYYDRIAGTEGAWRDAFAAPATA